MCGVKWNRAVNLKAMRHTANYIKWATRSQHFWSSLTYFMSSFEIHWPLEQHIKTCWLFLFILDSMREVFLILFCSFFWKRLYDTFKLRQVCKCKRWYLSQSSFTLHSEQFPQAFFAADFSIKEVGTLTGVFWQVGPCSSCTLPALQVKQETRIQMNETFGLITEHS